VSFKVDDIRYRDEFEGVDERSPQFFDGMEADDEVPHQYFY